MRRPLKNRNFQDISKFFSIWAPYSTTRQRIFMNDHLFDTASDEDSPLAASVRKPTPPDFGMRSNTVKPSIVIQEILAKSCTTPPKARRFLHQKEQIMAVPKSKSTRKITPRTLLLHEILPHCGEMTVD